MREDAKLRIMRLISHDASMSSRQIAKSVGVSHGSAYYILAALVKKGFVKLDNFRTNPNKRGYSYLLTSKGIHEKSLLTYQFIKRKRLEFENLRREIKMLENEVGTDSTPSILKEDLIISATRDKFITFFVRIKFA